MHRDEDARALGCIKIVAEAQLLQCSAPKPEHPLMQPCSSVVKGISALGEVRAPLPTHSSHACLAEGTAKQADVGSSMKGCSVKAA
jgi:hypothetical protein